MAQLLFFDQDHRYELDGEELPSVSEILRFMSREIYGNVNQWMLDNAADRGSRAHKACEVLDKHGEVQCNDDIAPYVRAYLQFLRDHKPSWEMIERPMHSKSGGYAGTIDRIGIIGGARWLIDLKNQETIKKPLVAAQLNGYERMAAGSDIAIAHIGCLQLKRDGRYKLHELPIDPDVFNSCLILHNALKTRKRRKTPSE